MVTRGGVSQGKLRRGMKLRLLVLWWAYLAGFVYVLKIQLGRASSFHIIRSNLKELKFKSCNIAC